MHNLRLGSPVILCLMSMSVIKERRSIIAKILSNYFINEALLDLWCNLNLSLESKESCGLRKIDSRRDPGPQPAELLRLL